jgi:multiple sugar transport system ATP-binding protein
MDEPLSNLDAKLRVQMRTQVSRIQKKLGTTTLYVTHDQTEAMTLGDRVVVMRGGVVQQVGSPAFLYDHPANLFVAGFIGSPSMNFVPATLDGGVLHSPLGDLALPDERRRAVESSSAASREVIVGLRPEHFEDAALVSDPSRGGTTQVTVDLVESMGSDVFAYFTVDAQLGGSGGLDELARDTGAEMGVGGVQVTARLEPTSRVGAGQPAKLWVDTSKIQVFDPKSGDNLTARVG